MIFGDTPSDHFSTSKFERWLRLVAVGFSLLLLTLTYLLNQ
jgi:hypothetical protein